MKFEQKVLNILYNGFGTNKANTDKKDDPGFNIGTVDQALINIYFHNITGLFSPEYNAVSIDFNYIKKFNKNSMDLYGIEDIYYCFKYPYIRHLYGPKKDISLDEDWGYIAKNSKYFNGITNNFLNIYNFSLYLN